MSEPTAGELRRAAAVLTPFVRRFDLPLNPEDMDLLAYAVLLHARSDRTPDEIAADVDRLIDEHVQAARQLYDAMPDPPPRD